MSRHTAQAHINSITKKWMPPMTQKMLDSGLQSFLGDPGSIPGIMFSTDFRLIFRVPALWMTPLVHSPSGERLYSIQAFTARKGNSPRPPGHKTPKSDTTGKNAPELICFFPLNMHTQSNCFPIKKQTHNALSMNKLTHSNPITLKEMFTLTHFV